MILALSIYFERMFTTGMRSGDLRLYCGTMKDPQHILQSVFGYDSFRTPQDEIIQTVIDGEQKLSWLKKNKMNLSLLVTCTNRNTI